MRMGRDKGLTQPFSWFPWSEPWLWSLQPVVQIWSNLLLPKQMLSQRGLGPWAPLRSRVCTGWGPEGKARAPDYGCWK